MEITIFLMVFMSAYFLDGLLKLKN